MDRIWTLDEARAELPSVLAHVDRLTAIRAELADARLSLGRGEPPRAGGLPEMKALEAQLQEAIDWFAPRGIDLKGFAPVIIDFPMQTESGVLLLCWLEGETALEWCHAPEVGFMGRRRIVESGVA